MKLYPIETGNFKLDGGAMFGVVPREIWQKTNPADAQNRIDIGARSLLVEHGKRLVLIDCGLGNKQSPEFFKHFSLWGDFSLEKSLAKYGFVPDDITDVFLTHLHFDHCGGAVKYDAQGQLVPSFKNANYWSNAQHWQWATEPNAREKASFLSENILPLQQSGQLNFIPSPKQGNLLSACDLGFDIFFADGHTEKMMLPIIPYQGTKVVFCSDLLATAGHVPLPYVMGYDTRPLQTLIEKEKLLKQVVDNQFVLFFQHDAHQCLASLKATEKGIRIDETFDFNQRFGY
jgi:glyoxylase-like metal-dependent hydrolase (beta-lactamase superfamily II)